MGCSTSALVKDAPILHQRELLRKRSRIVAIREVYELGGTLGRGGFSVVKLATHIKTKKTFAVKIMTLPGGKSRSDTLLREDIMKEISLLSMIRHPNIVPLIEYFQDEEKKKVYLVMDLLTGGELLDAVLEREMYSEADAKLVFKQLLNAVAYLHSISIVHRDLKLENVLLTTKGDFTSIQIADFGLSKWTEDSAMQTICGTPQYMAPEVLKAASTTLGRGEDAYTANVDMWSAGVILFILLGGYPPFYDGSEAVMFALIMKGKFNLDDPCWDNVSKSAKDLIQKLLVVDPSERLNSKDALDHPWMKSESVYDKPIFDTQEQIHKRFRRAKTCATVVKPRPLLTSL